MKMDIAHFPIYEEFKTRRLETIISFLEGDIVVGRTSDVNEIKKEYLYNKMACANQSESNVDEWQKMIEHYSVILDIISTMEDEDIDVLMSEFGIKDSRYFECNEKRSKAECILSTTVCRGKEEIKRFKEKLQMLLGNNQQLLQELKKCMTNAGKTVPPDFIQKYNSVNRESIRHLKDYLVEEVEIVKMLIPLLQLGAISINTYIQIKNQMSAVDQRNQLISFVLERENSNTIHGFLYVLHEIERDDILEALSSGQNSMRTGNCEDIDFSLSETVSVWELPHSQNMVENEQAIDGFAEEVLDIRLIDKWEGSVVLRLQSALKAEDFLNNRDKLARFLTKLYQDVKMQPGESKCIDLKIRIIPRNKCIERRKPLDRDSYISKKCHKHTRDTCLQCLQEIVRKNVKVLVAEIESDIISETFNQVGDTSAYVQNMCLSTKTTASRQQRALLFLKYALHEKSYLREFYNIFKTKRSTELVPVQCNTCSESSSTNGLDGTSDIQESKLTFILYRADGNNMVMNVDDFSKPTIGPSIITTNDDEKQITEFTRRNFQNVTTALEKEKSPPATLRRELLMTKESIPYDRQNSMPESVMEFLKTIIASNSYLSAKVSHLSTEVEKLKEIVKDRSV